jgi:hypothetical protein
LIEKARPAFFTVQFEKQFFLIFSSLVLTEAEPEKNKSRKMTAITFRRLEMVHLFWIVAPNVR